jgi:heptosyltransferase-1
VKKILIVKTSSLGDVVHNFPALADLRRRFPHAAVDWVVEEAYAPIVRMSGGVRKTIPVAVRRWRRRLLGAQTWREIADWRRVLGEESYDAVIDTQGLLKSAVLAAAATGRRHGFDAASARERAASRFYDVAHHVQRRLHAVERNRELVAASLGYRVDEPPEYGFHGIARSGAQGRDVVFLHSTSRADKHWAEERWIALGRLLERLDLDIVLPWGNEADRARSERIRASLRRARVPPALGMERIAQLLAGARAVAGVDTGLVHLSAALGRPVAAIYCATDPRLTGTYGAPRSINVGAPGRPPAPDEVMQALAACGAL